MNQNHPPFPPKAARSKPLPIPMRDTFPPQPLLAKKGEDFLSLLVWKFSSFTPVCQSPQPWQNLGFDSPSPSSTICEATLL
ncbi:hypothetical protein MRB53_026080 [Persea americana]|uniref:Uncharacterized protein n=1 Tax=Persea americana TaxID=3435 RepID=A0ACC2LI87_PERAE|nr:hypothetical protein MRB53_026080 [Persea americana]